MIVINVFFHIKKEQRDAYLAAMDVLVSHSQKEAGLSFTTCSLIQKMTLDLSSSKTGKMRQLSLLIMKVPTSKHLLVRLNNFLLKISVLWSVHKNKLGTYKKVSTS